MKERKRWQLLKTTPKKTLWKDTSSNGQKIRREIERKKKEWGWRWIRASSFKYITGRNTAAQLQNHLVTLSMAATSLYLHLRHMEENYSHTKNVREEQQFHTVCSSCWIQKCWRYLYIKCKINAKHQGRKKQQICSEYVVFVTNPAKGQSQNLPKQVQFPKNTPGAEPTVPHRHLVRV